MLITTLCAAGAALSLRLSVPQESLLPAEEFKVIVNWKVLADMSVLHVQQPSFSGLPVLRFEIDNGQAIRTYQEDGRVGELGASVDGPAKSGYEQAQLLTLRAGRFLGEPGQCCRRPFPVSGRFRMRVVYKDPFRDFEVASNWVAIEQKEGQVRERRDPETHQAPPHRGEELEQWQLGQYARLAIEILGAQDWGDFELDALRLAFSFALQARDVGLQNGIRTRLNERSPGWEQAPLLDLGGNY